MHQKKYMIATLLMIPLVLFIGFQFRHKEVKWDCPQRVMAAVTSGSLAAVRYPDLKGELEVYNSGDTRINTFPVRDLNWKLKHSNRENSGHVVKFSSLEVANLDPGTYQFDLVLRRASDDLKLARLQVKNVNIKAGSSTISFDDADWVYDDPKDNRNAIAIKDKMDSDGDGFNNVTEIMDGDFAAPASGETRGLWQPQEKSYTDLANYPTRTLLLQPSAMSVMAVGPSGNLRIVGDAFSVQPGVLVNAELVRSAGTPPTYTTSSELDGSFELIIPTGVSVGDKVKIYTVSREGLDATSLLTPIAFTRSLSASDSSRAQVTLEVKNLQGCQ